MTHTCASLVAENDYAPCGETAGVRLGIPLCDRHYYAMVARARVANVDEEALAAYPGLCYFAHYPDGTVKIGFSRDRDKLAKRFRVLNQREGGGVAPLLLLQGGSAAEAFYQNKFREHWAQGERFYLAPEILEFVEDAGRAGRALPLDET